MADHVERHPRVDARRLQLRRQDRLIRAANRAYLALAADPEAMREFREELELWDCTLADGLADEPWEEVRTSPLPQEPPSHEI